VGKQGSLGREKKEGGGNHIDWEKRNEKVVSRNTARQRKKGRGKEDRAR